MGLAAQKSAGPNMQSPTSFGRGAPKATAPALATTLICLAAAGGCGRAAAEEDVSSAEPTVSATAVMAPAGPEVTVTETTVSQLTYVIQDGDSLSTIAERFGISVRALADFNAISDVHAIKVGQELSIPPVTTTSIVGG